MSSENQDSENIPQEPVASSDDAQGAEVAAVDAQSAETQTTEPPPEQTPRRYWCHQCRRAVNVSGDLQCPNCSGGFVEEITPDDNPEEWSAMQAQEQIQDELSGFLQALGVGPGSVVVNRQGTGGTRQIIIQRGGSNGNRAPLTGAAPPGSVQGFNQLMMALMQLMQAPQGDANLDSLISRIMESDPNRFGPPPASTTAVESLEKITIVQDHLDKEADCAVCMESFALSDSATKMPCDHIFHDVCLASWLRQHNSCPVCRHELPTDDTDYERIRQRREEERAGHQQAPHHTAGNSSGGPSSSSHGLGRIFSRLSRQGRRNSRQE